MVKVRLCNKNNKIEIFKRKKMLSKHKEYSHVFIRSALSHTEVLLQHNMRTLLKQMPKGRSLRLTGSGKLIPKTIGEENNSATSNIFDRSTNLETYGVLTSGPSGSPGPSGSAGPAGVSRQDDS